MIPDSASAPPVPVFNPGIAFEAILDEKFWYPTNLGSSFVPAEA